MGKTINKVILLGHLTKQPEVRYTTSGTAVATVDLATNERFKDSSGNWTDKAEYHRIVLWQKLAEIAAEYLKKGSQVYVEGYLQTRSWDQNGTKKYSTEVVAKELVMCGGGGKSEAPQAEPAMAGASDDLPF